MSDSPLLIYAGKTAKQTILEQGLSPDLFSMMLGASGGPKWFVLAGLDKYIFGEYFKSRSKPLDVVGSSIGAFRFACAAKNDPVAATSLLAEQYSHTRYSDKPTSREITDKVDQLLQRILADDSVEQILNNSVIKPHIIVARAKGLTRFEQKTLQMAGLMIGAMQNLVSRSLLGWEFERVVLSAPNRRLNFADPYQITTKHVELSTQNLSRALSASGAIPLVIEGVKSLPNAPAGMYRDGGIIDYHYDLAFQPDEQKLVLYPHFSRHPKPGWFDKSLKSRTPKISSYDNVVMLAPSDEFVASLPNSKIPDRTDFETITADQRIQDWQQVIAQSERLAECFDQLCGKNLARKEILNFF